MTWSDAQSYCRQTYTDLSTITNTQDNSQVASMMPSYYEAWIGLYRKYWTWSNSSTASNLPWGPGQPDNSVNCATIVGSTGSFNSHNCDDQRPFLCSRDVKPSASRSVKVQLRVGSADLNDPTVQESILQQVRGHTRAPIQGTDRYNYCEMIESSESVQVQGHVTAHSCRDTGLV
ncbi:C-type lectin BML-2-like [Haplochromis burtoni]|uniref:C-type lectin BML-2-like n=1 Tax=Haplochromis burtoni TaxID=8153 RepID=UPI001C2DAC0D|nr:C-type lectin BML-2-like [Haplochromis burtoni]